MLIAIHQNTGASITQLDNQWNWVGPNCAEVTQISLIGDQQQIN